MEDDACLGDISLPLSRSNKPAPLKVTPTMEKTNGSNTYLKLDNATLERRSWASHQSEEEEDEGWMVTPLAEYCNKSHDLMEENEADVEASVREALRMLDLSSDGEDGGKSDDEREGDQKEAGRTDVSYMDFVQEVLNERWTQKDKKNEFCHWRTPAEPLDDDVEKSRMKKENSQQEMEEPDEWQEAYTAKGRVYYYNRRTRESSWKRPKHFNSSFASSQPTHAAEIDELDLQRSLNHQSHGCHASASPVASPGTTMERQDALYCTFCGDQQPSDRLAAHFQECASATFHKRQKSPLYRSFERALVVMSEDATLRALHYASSFPDPTPHPRSEASTVQDSLSLLRSRRRRNTAKKCSSADSTPQRLLRGQSRYFGTSGNDFKVSPDHLVDQERFSTFSHRQASGISVANLSKINTSMDSNSQATNNTFLSGPSTQSMEMCRYCSRSFAEGRLAKHEAVCPRVFGNEGSWGRGVPSHLASPLKPKNSRVGAVPSSVGSMTAKGQKLKDHTLQQSFKEHQATLVLCPCCHRKFAPSGAQQHIAICKEVQNRPKNPIPLLRDYAIASK
ncbi:hypothetical protein CCR75_008400 [Bremia lactucae]|uniref:WW domain-containing protein n=1 Tax=Bremia lactucae TaxID=4779 RepID=A0A976IDF9_BRELC|nr:hypothetical protein CCR75_008400 [Bremia lactucae]